MPILPLLVPLVGSGLAGPAVVRTGEYADAIDESVVVVLILPARKGYAREIGWTDPDEAFDPEGVIEASERRVTALLLSDHYEAEVIDEFPPPASTPDRIERFAERYDVGVAFRGSDTVGRIVKPLTSVGLNVAADPGYDAYLGRHPAP